MTSEALTWSTEQRNPATVDIDTMDSAGVVAAILAADAAVATAVAAVSEQIAAAVDLAVTAISAGGRVHYLGAGTSGRLGVLDAVELLPTYRVGSDVVTAHLAGGEQAMMKAVEGAEDDESLGAEVVDGAGEHDLIVGIAASGRTPYVRGALVAARERGLSTVLISSNVAAPLAQWADVAILPDTGPEVITGSTRMKAATAQKLVLNAFSTATMVRLGKTWSNLMVNVMATNAKLRRRTVNLLVQAAGVTDEVGAQLIDLAGGDLRVALVAALAGVQVSAAGVARAAEVVAEFAPSADRVGDPGGIRTAVATVRSN